MRKKGRFFFNERVVKLSDTGVLTYYHLDKPTVAKARIPLSDPTVMKSIKFVYAGKNKAKTGYPAHREDEIRLLIKSENYIFKSMTKIDHSTPSQIIPRALPVSAWEQAIRKFAKDSQIKVSYLH